MVALRRPGLLEYNFEYDDEGNLVRVHYPGDTERTFTYAPGGQMLSTTDRMGATTTIGLSSTGHVETITDPLERKTVYVTDDDDQLMGVLLPDESEELYEIDPDNDVALITRRDGSEVRLTRNDKGAISRIEWADGREVEFEFDGDDNVTKATSKDDEVTFEIDDGNPVAEKSKAGAVEYEYDSEGQLVTLTTPQGDIILYNYDGDGRLSGVVDWQGREVKLLYGPGGTLDTIRYPNALAESRTYPAVGRLGGAIVTDAAGRSIGEQSYAYDRLERLTEYSDKWGHGEADRWQRRFTYDAEDRLLAEVDPKTDQALLDYEYDAKGNMVRTGSTRIRVGPMDQPERVGGVAIQYDGLGNMVGLPGPHGPVQCEWNEDGTLAGAGRGRKTTRYKYDGFGRRIEKTDGRATTRFGWANHVLLWEEYQPTPEADPVRRDYLWVPDGFMPLAFREEGRTYWLQTDARGAVIRVFDEDGAVVWRATYDSFGQATIHVGKVRQPLRLVGQYYDEETGLHYNYTRYYSPSLRSYISLDPNWHRLDVPNYSYCGNDPWNKLDPFGQFIFCAILGALAVSAIVGAVVGGVVAAATGGDWVAGAVEGALGAVGTTAGFMIGGPAGAIAGGVIGSAVGAFAGSTIEQARKGGPVSIKCALLTGGVAALFDLALLGLGKIPGVKRLCKAVGKGLMRRGRKLFGPIAKGAKRLGKRALRAGRKLLRRAARAGRRGLLKARLAAKNAYRRVRGAVSDAVFDIRYGKLAREAAEKSGMTKGAAREALRIAKKHNARIRFRATNPHSTALRKAGHSGKPAFLKMKTVSPLDVHLGASPDDLGKVGYFKPKKPPASLKASNPALYGEAMEQYGKRAKEFKKYKKDVFDLERHGMIKVDKKTGTIIDTRPRINGKPNPGKGKSFTGDYDLFDITDVNGKPLSDKKRLAVLKDLKKPPVNAEHSDLMSWKKDSPDTFHQGAYDGMVKDHASKSAGGKGEALGDFSPSGFGQTFSSPGATAK